MNDKEKQIEEMARDICEYYNADGACYYDDRPCDLKCDAFTDAQYIYEKGYRKIPEDSVVLTETERITMCVEQWDKGYAQARKETAREIYRELCGHGTTYVKKWIKERYGVDATENENEC